MKEIVLPLMLRYKCQDLESRREPQGTTTERAWQNQGSRHSWRSQKSQLENNLAARDHKSKLRPDVLARIEEIVGNGLPTPQRF